MSGVKRPANTLGTPKTAKKKKARQETLPDSDEAPVMTNPYAEAMLQTPTEVMNEMPSKVPKTIESMVEFGPPFDGLYEQDSTLELPDTLPLLMSVRYQLLLEKTRPEERMEGTPPHLSWLETKYGHLVEKPVWYNRMVKLANTYIDVVPLGEKRIKDRTLGELENAVGHLVPYTEGEKEFLQLLEKIKKSRVQLAGEPDLACLRKQHSNPPQDSLHTNITRAALEDILTEPVAPEYSPDQMAREDSEGREETRYVPIPCYPIHENANMSRVKADDSCVLFLFKYEKPGCALFYTSDTAENVCHQHGQAIHPFVHRGLFDGTLKCHCEYTPRPRTQTRMKLSRTEKNPGRVFLTCFKKTDPCYYFQWLHWNVSKVDCS